MCYLAHFIQFLLHASLHPIIILGDSLIHLVFYFYFYFKRFVKSVILTAFKLFLDAFMFLFLRSAGEVGCSFHHTPVSRSAACQSVISKTAAAS